MQVANTESLVKLVVTEAQRVEECLQILVESQRLRGCSPQGLHLTEKMLPPL